jgi:hypothetical protein
MTVRVLGSWRFIGTGTLVLARYRILTDDAAWTFKVKDVNITLKHFRLALGLRG